MSNDQAGFVALPHFILQHPKLTPDSIILYAVLLHFDRAGGQGCFAKRETISKFSNLSLHKVRNAITILEAEGIISICRRRNSLTDVIRITPDCRPPINEAARPARRSARSRAPKATSKKSNTQDIKVFNTSISSNEIIQKNKMAQRAPYGVDHHKNKVPLDEHTEPSPKPNQHYQQATAELLGHLKTQISPKSIDAWFGDSWIEKQTDTEVIYRTGRGHYVAEWLSRHYISHIQAFTGKSVKVIS